MLQVKTSILLSNYWVKTIEWNGNKMGWHTKSASNNKYFGKNWENGENQCQYTQKCLQLCKSWNGPATSINELSEILKANCGKAEKTVRIELTYCRDTHKADPVQEPDLFKMNTISQGEKLHNLRALLSQHEPMANYVTKASNADAENLLSSSLNFCIEDEDSIQIGENFVIMIVEGNNNSRYIATCTKKNDNTYEMDHLHRVDDCSDFNWKHPAKADLDNLKPESIVECHING